MWSCKSIWIGNKMSHWIFNQNKWYMFVMLICKTVCHHQTNFSTYPLNHVLLWSFRTKKIWTKKQWNPAINFLNIRYIHHGRWFLYNLYFYNKGLSVLYMCIQFFLAYLLYKNVTIVSVPEIEKKNINSFFFSQKQIAFLFETWLSKKKVLI